MQKRPNSMILVLGVVVAVLLFAGLNKMLAPSVPGEHAEEQPTPAAVEKKPDTQPAPAKATAKGGREPKMVIMETTKGTIKFKLFTEEMPVTTKNFIDLVNRKFYDGLKFHRVENWVVQGGDPQGTGMGGSDKTIPLEINKKYRFNKAGTVGMARSSDPNSASSQFFFLTKPADHLSDGYALFGEVTSGMDVVNKLAIGDKMITVRVADGAAPTGKAGPAKTGGTKGKPEAPPPPPPPPAPPKMKQ